MRWAAVVCGLCAASGMPACRTHEETLPNSAATAASPGSDLPSARPRQSATASVSARPVSAPPASVTVTLGSSRGSFEVHAGDADVSLSTTVNVERAVDGGFSAAGVDFVYLVPDCSSTISLGKPPLPCVTVRAHSTLRPPPWTGMSCSSQCNLVCHYNAPVTPGKFRFVVHSCDGKTSYASPTFLMTKPRSTLLMMKPRHP